MTAPRAALAGMAVAVGALLVACGGGKPRPAPLKPAEARVEATLELPKGDGRAHIIVMPTDIFEASRCLVAVGPNGQAAVSCAPKGYEPPPDTTGQ